MQQTTDDITKCGLSGSALKIIALTTMLIDHFGAFYLYWRCTSPEMILLYNASRYIGRIAFPLFCFLLVEGFMHTRNVKKYALRLFIFALISELPFDLANFSGDISYYNSSQNVFFTLLFGLLTIWFMQMLSKTAFAKPLITTLQMAAALFFMLCAYFLHIDYAAFGIAAIVLIYLFTTKREPLPLLGSALACGVLMIMNPMEITAFIALILIYFYNGTRGASLKYAFYAFYPIHLLLFFAVNFFFPIREISTFIG